MMIKRTTLNRVIDALAFVGFVLVATTGFLLHVLLPPGSGRLYGVGTGYRAAGKSVALLWGLTRHDWGAIHFWVAVGLMVVLAIHLGLHWRWIACSLRGRPREGSGLRAALGLMGLVILLAIAVTPWLSPIARVTRAQHLAPSPPAASLAPHQESMTPPARGMMTLRELEAVTGVPVAHVIAQLGLPSTVSPDERLGRLHQRYGVTLHDIRRIIVTYPRWGKEGLKRWGKDRRVVYGVSENTKGGGSCLSGHSMASKGGVYEYVHDVEKSRCRKSIALLSRLGPPMGATTHVCE